MKSEGKGGLLKGDLAKFCEKAIKDGDAMGMAQHQYTVWGADFDDEGFVKGLFVTDSRDFRSNKIQSTNERVGLKYIDLEYGEDNLAYTPISCG